MFKRSVLCTSITGAALLTLLTSGCTTGTAGTAESAPASASATGTPAATTTPSPSATPAPSASTAVAPNCDDIITPEAEAELASLGLEPQTFIPSPGYDWHDHLQTMIDQGGVVCEWGGGGDLGATFAWAPADAATQESVEASLVAGGWTEQVDPDGSIFTRPDSAEPNYTTPFLFSTGFYLSALTTDDLADFTLRTN